MQYKETSVQGTVDLNTYATLYNTDAHTAVLSTILVCNTSATDATYRVAVMSTAGIPGAADWRVYNKIVPAEDTAVLALGLAMQANRFIRVSSNTSAVTFAAEISEF